ncbi:retron St85 family RNA-directed DNA polymerase [Pseudomonas salomonii]|uniref:RNA-directed DNA polymerase n=1 Tax=Pseudomonas salomonii TaxID=191391 RepID=A0A1H3TYI4_9PSED|nr:retron St85 family RNA-directed DNA polymerase [Pseudomonas salomonii]SDZ55303.1 Retron-type reverse transcriptase [Pseudomonas salomonii]
MDVYDFRKHVSETLAIPSHDVARLIIRAPHTYKKYEILKKDGGSRSIAQPARETKVIQRLLMENLFCYLPVHECAVAYKIGSSIKKNAQQHRQNQFISKFDFRNFFGSITERDIAAHLRYVFVGKISENSISDIARVCCIRNTLTGNLCLSIGAPSSPVLSNSILYYFDIAIQTWCNERNIVYTRYADDMTFSSNEKGVTASIESFLKQTLKDIKHPSLVLNEKKTIHLSRKHQRRITGLVLSNDGSISLGREKKRLISVMIHHYLLQKLDEKDVPILQGLLGFAKDAEPLFVSRMRAKYGSFAISEIMRGRMKK